jgi:hypothetical protein
LGKGATTFQIIKIRVKNDTTPPLGGLGGKRNRKLGARTKKQELGGRKSGEEMIFKSYPNNMLKFLFTSHSQTDRLQFSDGET